MSSVEHRTKRPSLVDRFALRLSTGRRIDGLWIGVFMDLEPEPILRRVEEALYLNVHDRLRYDRLVRDVERVWVRLVPGGLGRYTESLHACELDRQFVLAETSSANLIAAIIVHEATHARLLRCGIGYEEELRPRVEAVCLRRELARAQGRAADGSVVQLVIEGLLSEHDLVRKPVTIPDQVRDKLFGIML